LDASFPTYCCALCHAYPRRSCKPLSPALSPPSWSSSAARLPNAVYSFKHALVQDAAHSSMLRSFRERLHAQIAEAFEAHFPDTMEDQPEILARHCAEAGLIEKSVAYWGKAGHRSATRSAMAEAAAQFQKALDQLALLPDNPELHSDMSFDFAVLWV